ncbi:MAG: VCBS repeat-containing protein [Planctomycetota bacterium]
MGSSPRVVDWNNDGKKDLIVGEREGRIYLFINTGTHAAPVFAGSTFIEVGGSTFDCGFNSMPVVVDWNEDGKKDLLCGEHDGKIFLLINSNTDADPVFQTSTFIQDGMNDLDIGGRTSPDVVDWDRDGIKDIVAGETLGNIFFIRNVGTNENPAFHGYTLLEADGAVIDVDYNSRPFAVDWDNDGVQDLLCGCYDTTVSTGLVWYYHSQGPLSIDRNQLSAATGGMIQFNLDAGAGNANRNYLILGSATGKTPGYPLPGGLVTLPLNWDVYTDLVFAFMNTALFNHFLGTLDGNGESAAQLNAPALPPTAVGAILYHAYCMNNPFNFVSNAIEIEVIP